MASDSVRPWRAAATPRCTTAGVMRLRVPRWSWAPHLPQFETRAANCSSSAVSGMGARYLARVSHSSAGVPLPGEYRMPAETETHERTLVAWPPDVPQCIFTPDQLEPARADYAEIARAIARYEPVTLVVRPGDIASATERVGDAVDIVAFEIDDAWIRDDGPIVVRAPDGSLTAVHFR